MLRRSLTTFRKDDSGMVTVDFLGITAILLAMAISVFSIVTSSLPNSLFKIQQSLQTGQAVTGVVTISNVRQTDLAFVENDG